MTSYTMWISRDASGSLRIWDEEPNWGETMWLRAKETTWFRKLPPGMFPDLKPGATRKVRLG